MSTCRWVCVTEPEDGLILGMLAWCPDSGRNHAEITQVAVARLHLPELAQSPGEGGYLGRRGSRT